MKHPAVAESLPDDPPASQRFLALSDDESELFSLYCIPHPKSEILSVSLSVWYANILEWKRAGTIEELTEFVSLINISINIKEQVTQRNCIVVYGTVSLIKGHSEVK